MSWFRKSRSPDPPEAKEATCGKPRCSYCGGTDFFEGPSGGVCVNIRCANEKCRHWFNFTPFGLEDLNRVDPTPHEEEMQHQDALQSEKSLRDRIFAEGQSMRAAGRPALDCLRSTKNNACGFYNAGGDDLVRLCGWLSESLPPTLPKLVACDGCGAKDGESCRNHLMFYLKKECRRQS